MDATELLDTLGYRESPNFLSAVRLGESVEHAHVFRRAVQACVLHNGEFHGVYQLRDASRASTPVVYVAEAASADEADNIHRKLWNQNVAPFLLVRLPDCLRLYSGFCFAAPSGRHRDPKSGLLEAAIAFDRVLEKIDELRAAEIDAGVLWRVRGQFVDPSSRVDRTLLRNLKELGHWLREQRGLAPSVAHALIGKFVYLRYLRDRQILSDRRLQDFGVDVDEVFGRRATLAGVRRLVEQVDSWLNGAVFPLPFTGKGALRAPEVREVALVFLGDDPESGQLHLDFRAYDFSYIPVETLSIIYEQFLAAEGGDHDVGAFYTPLPVVSFMLNELDELLPLERGMRVLDPSCGSGAFLVQCYRRLVERVVQGGASLRPAELRELLVRHIFGVERDGDACRVAGLSLILTMLDYIDPPDLLSTPRFKLPDLHNQNVFEADFFEDAWASEMRGVRFDWIVGNPPWLQLKPAKQEGDLNQPARAWMAANVSERPVVRYQVAEAFAWEVRSHASDRAAIAMLLPAMTLLSEGTAFREAFFSSAQVVAVANFTNLRRVLFAGRAEQPAAAFFYRGSGHRETEGDVLVYSPLVANQEANRPVSEGKRTQTWAIPLNRSEIRAVPQEEAARGSGLSWTMAMWGSARDRRLFESVRRRFPSLDDFSRDLGLRVSEGPQLRSPIGATDELREVVGKPELVTKRLRNVGKFHSFPDDCFRTVSPDRGFVRKGRGKAVEICRPPHVIVSAARTFAVYTDKFVVVPPRQIGIAGELKDTNTLRAMALYLSSDFAAYHQFFASTQAETRGRYTLAALRRLPVPLGELDEETLERWAKFHCELVTASVVGSGLVKGLTEFWQGSVSKRQLEHELNVFVEDALGLSESERWLIHDFVHVRKSLADGLVREAATGRPSQDDMMAFANALRHELDAFLDPELRLEHRVAVGGAVASGVVHVSLADAGEGVSIVLASDEELAGTLGSIRTRIRQAHSQWLYFDRNLFVHEEDSALIMKPMQRMWWTRSQALLDADELIAQVLTPEPS